MNLTLPEEAKPVNAQVHLSTALAHRLIGWFPEVVHSSSRYDTDKLAHSRVTAIVAIYDAALAKLEGKTGARADAAREQIRAARGPFAAQLELVNGLGAGLDGPLALTLQSRIDSTRAALAKVLHDIHFATRATVADLLVEKERCLADIRVLDRDLAALYAGIIPPKPLPDIDELQSAEASTRALERQPAKPSATQVHGAIEQGLKAPARVGALWVAFENAEHELVKWRARAFTEAQAAANEAQAAE